MTEKTYQLTLTITADTLTLTTPKGIAKTIKYCPLQGDMSSEVQFVMDLAGQCLSADESLCCFRQKQLKGEL